jgi:hypothetical protein
MDRTFAMNLPRCGSNSSGLADSIKVHNRLLRPLMATTQPKAPPELRQALRVIDQHVDASITRARLGKAA